MRNYETSRIALWNIKPIFSILVYGYIVVLRQFFNCRPSIIKPKQQEYRCSIMFKNAVIIIIIMRVIDIAPKNVKQTHRRSHCTSAKRMTSILRHAEVVLHNIVGRVWFGTPLRLSFCSAKCIADQRFKSHHPPLMAVWYVPYPHCLSN